MSRRPPPFPFKIHTLIDFSATRHSRKRS